MKKELTMLGLACVVALAGCGAERANPAGAATVKNGAIRTAPAETNYIALEGPEGIVGDVPLPMQPFGFITPSEEPLSAYGASIGYDGRHHVSAFRMTEPLEATLREFIQAHSAERVVQRMPALSAYADYEGSALNGSTRSDFFVFPGEDGGTLVRVAYDVEGGREADVLSEMARRLIAYPSGAATAARALFEGGAPPDEPANASFVPFRDVGYGLYAGAPLETFEDEDGTAVGLNGGRERIGLHSWSLEEAGTAYDKIVAFGADAPVVWDRELASITEYRGTKMEPSGARCDFFLYTNTAASEHVLVSLRYYDESKEEVLPLLLETASTLRQS
ncbi:hypothetical protein MO973_15260 [Paenibacillus sp. TRM 82003]|nr:hypothetical protein [Paenibacillus sp. TRM 82003]